MPHEFDAAAVAYRNARQRCQVLSGAALAAAQDAEGLAVEALIKTPTVHLGEIGDKLAALADLMQLGAWSDGRDTRLLASIRRDLKRAPTLAEAKP
jgi:hypothetical protein